MNRTRKAALALFLITFAFLTVYIFTENISFGYKKILCIAAFVVLCLAIFISDKKGNRSVNFALFLFSCTLVILLVEILFRLFPGLFPAALQNRVGETSAARSLYVEYLPENPYAKPRPNTIIRSQGKHRGTEQEFAYEWLSDKNGFKNRPELADGDTPVLALGDSFTEGMGVKIDDTWSSRLTDLGYPTYSLGVQGYAPSQFAGSFKQYGIQRKPKLIIIGYTARIYPRELVIGEKLTGGIASLAAASEIRDQYRYCITGIAKLTSEKIRSLRKGSPPAVLPGKGNEISILSTYTSEYTLEQNALIDHDTLSTDAGWISTLRSFEEIISIARKENIQVILMYMPRRGFTYYKLYTGSSLPENQGSYTEISLFKIFAKENGIYFLDTTPDLEEYTSLLIDSGGDSDQLPYLRIDGHLSPAGNLIVAKSIARFIKENNIVLQQE